uniref:Protein kinase domain-containing protein n=2 Tax=Dendroctonus ponderosae TaxID=77166 RepID=A0AAR5QFE2_DENPD
MTLSTLCPFAAVVTFFAIVDLHAAAASSPSASKTNFPRRTCKADELEEICFAKNRTYQQHSKSGHISIGPHHLDKCDVKTISYKVFNGAKINVYPASENSDTWTISINEASALVNISCFIVTPEYSRNYSKLLEIRQDFQECTTPRPQETHKIHRTKLRKGERIDNIFFLDHAPIGTNKYQAFIANASISGLLVPDCTYHVDNRNGRNGTIIHCRLKATKSASFKTDFSFLFGLTNTNSACQDKDSTGYINITFGMGSRRIKRANIFNNNSKIFRTAAPFARVTQPAAQSSYMGKYRCEAINAPRNPFSITREGIIYVDDIGALKVAPENVRLNISWTRNNSTEYEEINVRLVMEPTQTCSHYSADDWIHSRCSSYSSPKSCTRKDSCGLGTGGDTGYQIRNHLETYRCIWRGDKNPDNHETHLYSTCTSDPRFCPDGNCDSLEELAAEDLCPQDCTTKPAFPAKLSKAGRGIDKCNGVLVCDDMGCSCQLKFFASKILPVEPKDDRLIADEQPERLACDTECIFLATGGLLVAVFAIFFSIILWRTVRKRRSSKDKYLENLQEAETPFSDYIDRTVINEPLVLNFHMSRSLENTSANGVKSIKVDAKWKFPRHQIFIEQVLGEGEFGKVLKAKAFNIASRPGYSLVAVKTLKNDARNQDYNDLFSEYQLLKEVNHPHVIQLLGVCSSEDGPLYVIIEYAAFGSLRNYLRKSRHILTAAELGHLEDTFEHKVTARDILSFARQIASGMSYLSDIKLVHRDLAARNILLAENKVCKISDFGLTRDIYEDNAYFKKSKGRVPVKWMAPESLADHLYTTKSDVWSFGVLIWELVTLGASPYPGIQVQNLYNLLKQGYRMERPPNCSTVLYSLMNRCWNVNPEARPSFLDLYHCFDNLLTDNVSYLDLSDNSIINRSYFTNFSIEADSGSADGKDEKVNFLQYSVSKSSLEIGEKMNGIKEQCLGYETPVKAPKPVTPTAALEEYTDMDSKV